MNSDYLAIKMSRRLEMWRKRSQYGPQTMGEFVKGNLQAQSFWGGTPFKIDGSSLHARWVESPDSHLRFTGVSYDILKENHYSRDLNRGWYTDNFQSEVARGVVYQLPARDGVCQYLAGVADPCNSDKDGTGPCMIEVKADGMPYLYDDKEDAAKCADSLAEHYAESEREYDAKAQAEMQIDDKRQEIDMVRGKIRVLVAEMRRIKGHCESPVICGALWDSIAEYRDEIHTAFRRIKTLTDEPWRAVC